MSSIQDFKVKFQYVQCRSPCQSELKGHQHKRLFAKTDPKQTGCLQRAGKRSITCWQYGGLWEPLLWSRKNIRGSRWTQREVRALWRQRCLLSCWITLRCSVWSGHRSDVSLSSWTHWLRFMWRRWCLDVPVGLCLTVVVAGAVVSGCLYSTRVASNVNLQLWKSLKLSFTNMALYLQDFWNTSLIWLFSPHGKWHPALHVVWFPFVWGY